MDEGSSSSSRPPSSSIHLGSSSRSIDRHNPIIRDPTRRIAAKPLHPPSSSHPPPPPLPTITPKRYNLLHLLHHKGRKCSSSNPNNQTNKSSARSSSSTRQKKKSSSADLMSRSDSSSSSSSSRYLLGDMAFLDILSDFDPFLELVPVDHSTYSQSVKPIESSASKPPSSSRSPPQVVVLRVSLHCKGCEGKVRKHISRMQGVTSFNIDFAAKKVTVVGDVTPLGVLASLSKVKKNAQLWTPAMSSSEIKETKRVGE